MSGNHEFCIAKSWGPMGCLCTSFSCQKAFQSDFGAYRVWHWFRRTGEHQKGETKREVRLGFCGNVQVPIISCEDLQLAAVRCELLRQFPKVLISRVGRQSATICESMGLLCVNSLCPNCETNPPPPPPFRTRGEPKGQCKLISLDFLALKPLYETTQIHTHTHTPTPNPRLKDGKGWGRKRWDLKMPFSTWKNPENPPENVLIF